MPYNRGTRRKPNYVGVAFYKGRRKWVSGCASVAEYNEALERARDELREQVEHPDAKQVPTCLEFAGAVIGEDGRITMIWPDGQRCQKKTGRRDSSVERMRQALKPFLLEFSERPIDSFSRDEALTWILPKSQQVQQSVRQFFNHAKDRELISENKFACTGASKVKRRVERPDFEIVTDEQYERILHCARTSRADEYTIVIEGIVLCVGEAAIRPSEIFALHKDSIDLDADVIDVRWTLQTVPGGLRGVVDPALLDPAQRKVFDGLLAEGNTEVTATIELAAPASAIGIDVQNLIEARGIGLALPLKVKLSNPFLGASCYIGSNAHPIVVPFTTGRTDTTRPSSPHGPIVGKPGHAKFEDDYNLVTIREGSLVSDSFPAPRVTGCGGADSYRVDPALDAKLGLPAAAGHNTAILKRHAARRKRPGNFGLGAPGGSDSAKTPSR